MEVGNDQTGRFSQGRGKSEVSIVVWAVLCW